MKHKSVKIHQVFGDLTVIKNKSSKRKYGILCKCKCGKIVDVSVYNLLSGNTTSCRCQWSKIKSREGLASYNSLYNTYKTNAKKQDRAFKLTFDQFKSLITAKCSYCGSDPILYNKYLTKEGKQTRKDKKYKQSTIEMSNIVFNGIDRKNNNIGYTLQNCVTCCKICNRAKRDMDYEEFKGWIKKLISYYSS